MPGFTAKAVGLLFARSAYDDAVATWWLPPLHIALLMLAPAHGVMAESGGCLVAWVLTRKP